jgi:hypothetical protein
MRIPSPHPCAFAMLLLAAAPAFAELTVEQKIIDFLNIADAYAVQYGPYEWKRQALGFEMLDLRPWLDRIRRTTDDLDYAEVLVDYVASLDDAHVQIQFPLNYSGNLGLTLDIYEGKVLIDSINRARLPAARFPFQVGDELLSVDGRTVQDWIVQFRKYSRSANPESTDRSAVTRIMSRSQVLMPSMAELPEESAVQIRRQSGDVESYSLPWLVTGQRATGFGRPLTPGLRTAAAGLRNQAPEPYDDSLPAHWRPMQQHLNAYVDPSFSAVLGIGSRVPIFRLPANFAVRQGASAADFYLSGTYAAEGLRIGYIRIPSFSPPSAALALQQFETEMRFFEANTDGLIVDDMRNPGGSVAYVEGVAQRLHTQPFRTLGFEIRATAGWVFNFQSSLNLARTLGQEQWVINLLEANLAQVRQANSEIRGRTGPVTLNSTGSLMLEPHPAAYTKPIVILVDSFSASAGDMLPAILQDSGRALVVGRRTMGAGGNVVGFPTGGYSEAFFRVTQSLMHRRAPVVSADLPAAPYVENIGVRPDVELEYMTRENLLNGGATFLQELNRIAATHFRGGR